MADCIISYLKEVTCQTIKNCKSQKKKTSKAAIFVALDKSSLIEQTYHCFCCSIVFSHHVFLTITKTKPCFLKESFEH